MITAPAFAGARRSWTKFLWILLLLLAAPAHAQSFPPLTGRVVDNANLLSAEQETALTAKLEQLETGTQRQLVVATVPDLQGYPIEDYGYRLGREWGIGQKGQNNGVILIVAPKERKMRIEVGYGLEPYLTDALSSVIIREQMRPRFRDGDYPGGIQAGVDAIVAQLQLPVDQARARQDQVLSAQRAERGGSGEGGFPIGLIFWVMVAGFVLLSMRRGRHRKGMYGSRRYKRDSNWPVWLWVASEIAESASRSRGGGWGGGGFGGGGWGGGGGFSGGGGSFGGGGASGDW